MKKRIINFLRLIGFIFTTEAFSSNIEVIMDVYISPVDPGLAQKYRMDQVGSFVVSLPGGQGLESSVNDIMNNRADIYQTVLRNVGLGEDHYIETMAIIAKDNNGYIDWDTKDERALLNRPVASLNLNRYERIEVEVRISDYGD